MGDHSSDEDAAVVKNTEKSQEQKTGPPIQYMLLLGQNKLLLPVVFTGGPIQDFLSVQG